PPAPTPPFPYPTLFRSSRIWAIPPARVTRSNRITPTHEPSSARNCVGAGATAQRPIPTEIIPSSLGTGQWPPRRGREQPSDHQRSEEHTSELQSLTNLV